MFALRSFLVALAVACASLGCNAIDAKPEAEKVAERGFVSRISQSRETTLALYHDAFYQTIPRDEWRGMLDSLDAKLGVPESYNLSTWQVFVGSGAAGGGTYVTLAYDVRYANASGKETLVLYSSGAGPEPQIVGHSINSPALLAR